MRPATHLPMENEYVPQVYGRGWQESDLVSEQRRQQFLEALWRIPLAIAILAVIAAVIFTVVMYCGAWLNPLPPRSPNTLSAHRTAPTAGLQTLAGWSPTVSQNRTASAFPCDIIQGRLTAVRRPTNED